MNNSDQEKSKNSNQEQNAQGAIGGSGTGRGTGGRKSIDKSRIEFKWFVIHAYQCHLAYLANPKRKICQELCCSSLQYFLIHLKNCKLNEDCPDKDYCFEIRNVVAHYNGCIIINCQICGPYRLNGYQKVIRKLNGGR